jgi:hypothetical protein
MYVSVLVRVYVRFPSPVIQIRILSKKKKFPQPCNGREELGFRDPIPCTGHTTAPGRSPAALDPLFSFQARCSDGQLRISLWIGWLSNRRSKGATHRPSPLLSIPTISGGRYALPSSRFLTRCDSSLSCASLTSSALQPPARHSSPTGGTDCPKRSAAAGLGLPDDPIAEIISRLPAKALFRFKCVSQAWFRLITDWFRKSLKVPPNITRFLLWEERREQLWAFLRPVGGICASCRPLLRLPPTAT